MTNLHETNAHGKVGGIRASLAEQLAAFRPAPPAAPAASVKPADSTGSLEPNTGTVAFAAAVKPAITGTARVKPNTGVAAKPTMGAKPELASTRAASSGAKPRHVEPDETMWAASKRDGSVVAIQLLSGESFSGVVRSFGLYNLLLTVADGCEVLLLKSAIAWARKATTTTTATATTDTGATVASRDTTAAATGER
jgi:hypothetical protein